MVGRFLQEDTYRGDGLNLYAYCANNPVSYFDPSGLKKKDICMPPEQNNLGDDSDLQLPPNTTKTGKEGSKEWNDAEKKIKEGRGKVSDGTLWEAQTAR